MLCGTGTIVSRQRSNHKNNAVPQNDDALKETNSLHPPSAEQFCEAAGSVSAALCSVDLSNGAQAEEVCAERRVMRCQGRAFIRLHQARCRAVREVTRH